MRSLTSTSLNIKNVLAIRGDARKFEGQFVPEEDGHEYALDLVKQIADLNQGRYLDDNIENGERTDFCIGIAGYPEKHFEAPNLDLDMNFTKQKIEAGAQYIVTQMFFDNAKYFEYVKKCREAGMTERSQVAQAGYAEHLPEHPHRDAPDRSA